MIINTLTNRISEYWEEPHSNWGNTDTWDHYFIEKIPDATRHKSHSALGAELETLIRTLKPGTRASRKALAMQRDLKVSVLKQRMCYALCCWYGEEERSVLCTP